MRNIFFRREGQIAPFMIAIIVVLIIALMITANIGKIGLTKTHTANAADAGALAGSTMHANTLNTLANTNSAMIAEYLATQVTFLIRMPICAEWKRYAAYLAFVAAQSAQFTLAWQNGSKGYEEARSAAKQFAFMNAGIDEPKPRLEGESYEAYLQRESRFGQWMKDKGYESGVYTWTDKNGKENSFTVNVDAPGFPGLIPMSGVLVGLYRDGPFPVCTWCTDCCLGCEIALGIYAGCLATAGGLPLTRLRDRGILLPCEEGLCCYRCMAFVSVRNPGGFTWKGTFIFPSMARCGAPVWNRILYFVPIAYIAGIVSDNPQLTVTTRRLEPDANLGLREMKYGAISSSAKAEAKGGSVGPAPDPSYDSYLIPGGY